MSSKNTETKKQINKLIKRKTPRKCSKMIWRNRMIILSRGLQHVVVQNKTTQSLNWRTSLQTHRTFWRVIFLRSITQWFPRRQNRLKRHVAPHQFLSSSSLLGTKTRTRKATALEQLVAPWQRAWVLLSLKCYPANEIRYRCKTKNCRNYTICLQK